MTHPIPAIVPGTSKTILRALKTGESSIYALPLNAIRKRPGFNNPREVDPDYPQVVRDMADSIKANGFMKTRPIEVACDVDGVVWINDGNTRYDGAVLAVSEGYKLESVPVVNEERGKSEEDRVVGLLKTGRPLVPYGEALVVKQLLDMGVSEADVTKRTGIKKPKIDALMDLLSAPSEVRKMVATGTVAASLAVKTVKTEGKGAAEVLKRGAAVAKSKGRTKVLPKDVKPATPRKQPAAAKPAPMVTPPEVIAKVVHAQLPVTMRAILSFAQVEAVIKTYRKVSK